MPSALLRPAKLWQHASQHDLGSPSEGIAPLKMQAAEADRPGPIGTRAGAEIYVVRSAHEHSAEAGLQTGCQLAGHARGSVGC